MNITNSLFKILSHIESKTVSLFSVNVEKQMNYMNSLGIPCDLIERSFFQYKCQMFLKSKLMICLYNIGAIPFILYYFNRHNKVIDVKKENAIFLGLGLTDDFIPDELLMKYKKIINLNVSKEFLSREDKRYIMKIWRRYPFSFYFVLKCLIKIRMYSYIINKYRPNAIITSEEFSFASSCLTDYCRKRHVEHINIMHGEKFLFIRDAFVSFDKFYIWDEFYESLFIQLKAAKEQFVISVPEVLKIKNNNGIEKTIDFTYYFTNEDKASLKIVAANMRKLKEKGYIVAVRCHPRYVDEKIVESVFKDIALIESKSISINDSLLRTKNAVSVFSTVLNQAYFNKVNAVIDDVSNHEKYSKLKELKYRFAGLKGEHLLSFFLD